MGTPFGAIDYKPGTRASAQHVGAFCLLVGLCCPFVSLFCLLVVLFCPFVGLFCRYQALGPVIFFASSRTVRPLNKGGLRASDEDAPLQQSRL